MNIEPLVYQPVHCELEQRIYTVTDKWITGRKLTTGHSARIPGAAIAFANCVADRGPARPERSLFGRRVTLASADFLVPLLNCYHC